MLWRFLSVRYDSLWPLVSLLVGAYACGCFVLLRLFFRRCAATIGGVVLTLSPVMLSMIVYLRDYGKAPFFVWGIAFLVLAARASTLRAALLWALLAGMTVGIGYGFRSDVIILLPIGLLFLAVGWKPGHWLRRAGACASFAAATFLLAAPVLSAVSPGGSGFLVMEGLSEPFRAYLALDNAPYEFGQRYSDEFALSAIAAELRPLDPAGWDAREGAAFQTITQAVTRSGEHVRNWLPFFSGDLATQVMKSAAWIVGFPALVAPGRLGNDPGGPVRAGPGAAQRLSFLYNFLGRSWLPAVCLLGLIAFFWRVDVASPRAAFALFLMLGALLAYPVVQFSIRHIFHLEFIWVIALLALIHLPFDVRTSGRVSLRFVALVAVVGAVIFGSHYGLTWYQDRSLAKLFGALLEQPRELVADRSSGVKGDGKEVFAVPLPDQYRSLVEGALDSMTNRMGALGVQSNVRAAADRLLITLGGSECPPGKLSLSARYVTHEAVWQPFDHDIAVDRQNGDVTVLVPAFYRPTQYLSGIEVPVAQAGCIAKIERLNGPTVLPVILTAVLPAGWQQRPLHRGFGGFPVNGVSVR